jgi:hypothetical protein
VSKLNKLTCLLSVHFAAGKSQGRIADIDIESDHDPAAANSQKSVTTRTVSKINQKEVYHA